MATEKRLIDANAYIDELKWLQANVNSASAIEIQEYIDRANRQPTVDAVEVVRCGECKYFCEPFCIRRDDETHRERINMLTVDFCSYGERRTNEN